MAMAVRRTLLYRGKFKKKHQKMSGDIGWVTRKRLQKQLGEELGIEARILEDFEPSGVDVEYE